MLRTTLFAVTLAVPLFAFGAAQAQDAGPRLVGGGVNTEAVYASPSHNVVGGGTATITGGDDNLRIAYGPRVENQAAPAYRAELTGGGDNTQVVYHEVVPSTSMLAGRDNRIGG